jgi:hypothetical protein
VATDGDLLSNSNATSDSMFEVVAPNIPSSSSIRGEGGRITRSFTSTSTFTIRLFRLAFTISYTCSLSLLALVSGALILSMESLCNETPRQEKRVSQCCRLKQLMSAQGPLTTQ